jgi:hypothetical protein
MIGHFERRYKFADAVKQEMTIVDIVECLLSDGGRCYWVIVVAIWWSKVDRNRVVVFGLLVAMQDKEFIPPATERQTTRGDKCTEY